MPSVPAALEPSTEHVAGRPPIISLLVTGLGQGGAETQVVALARHLKASGWDTEVVSLLPTGYSPDTQRFLALLESSAIPVWSPEIARWNSALAGLWSMLKHLRDRRPQVLCTFMFHANVCGAILGRIIGTSVVVSSIRNERFGSRWRERLEALTGLLVDVTVVNSASVAQSLVSRGVIRRRRCRVIPNAVDLLHFAPRDSSVRESARARLGVPPGAFLWLTVGRLERQKDHEHLLQAVALLRTRHADVRVIVAGDGPLRESLRQATTALGLAASVSWLGVRLDVPDLLAASDAFVLSSRWEGSPNVVLEALAAGLPIAATNVGGLPDLVLPGKTGYLVPAGDADALAAAMQRVMELPDAKRSRMGACGRSSIQGRHDSTAVLRQWEQLLSTEWRAYLARA